MVSIIIKLHKLSSISIVFLETLLLVIKKQAKNQFANITLTLLVGKSLYLILIFNGVLANYKELLIDLLTFLKSLYGLVHGFLLTKWKNSHIKIFQP